MSFIIAVILTLLMPTSAFAHSGRTDSSGCHTCYTNCTSYGLSYGEYHCHNAPASSYSATPTPTSCPMNSTAKSDGKCYCDTGFMINSTQTQCIIDPEYIKTQCSNTTLTYDPTACSTLNQSCMAQLGSGATWSVKTNQCECTDKYTCTTLTGVSSPTTIPEIKLTFSESVNTSANNQQDNFVNEQIVLQTFVNTTLINRLLGNILLQVENHGEAWYLNPIAKKRYYMKDGETAYQMMRSFGLGITDTDFKRVQTDSIFRNRFKGRILLTVQQHGEAYYILPKDGSINYLKDGIAAYEIMRKLSLGITNNDLAQIPIEKFVPVK